MNYPEAKVYSDGSHYIGIPYISRPKKPSYGFSERTYLVASDDVKYFGDLGGFEVSERELFNAFFSSALHMSAEERRLFIYEKMKPYTRSRTENVVRCNFERMRRNLICRRQRLTRKMNLCGFNYFVTLTYDSKKVTEELFKKQVKKTLANNSTRANWRYAAVWERSPEKQRLHLHGLFSIPDGTMPGVIIEVRDFSLKTHRMQITHQNTYFNNRFGRSDFDVIDSPVRRGDAMTYICKYLEKSGERLFYSRGLPEYLYSDILEDDVVCRVGVGGRKLLLFDDFNIIQDGEWLGTPVNNAYNLSKTC